ncbi:MAG TPA: MFS transporter [Candidatus Omnitrophota bacterium]|nr:MFS transporter [Candidatus Omnitrophota bacterium]HQQ05863.1 MFS transporter [Candidatus Omnitrophota bacterium]
MEHKDYGFRKLFKNRNFFLLWLGQIISQLGDRLSQMALIGLVYAREGTSIQFAKILSFTIIPVFLIGPLAGALVDKWDRRKTMYVCDFIRAGLVVLIPLFLFYKQTFIWIYLIIFAAFSIGRFFVPAKLAIIPEIVDAKDLLLANSLINTTGMIAAVLGFGISGLIVERWGARTGFYLDAASFLVSGACIFFISKKVKARLDLGAVSKEIVKVIKQSVFAEMKDGILYFVKTRAIRLTAGIIFLLWSALGAVYVVIIVFVQRTLHSATKDLGFLIMFLGIGLFLGSLVYGRFGEKISRYKIIFICLIASGIMVIGFTIGVQRYPCFAFAALLALLLGLCISPIMIASNTIIHDSSAHHMLGKIFSSLEIVMHLAFLIFMFVSSILADRIPPGNILISVGIIVGITGTWCLMVNPRAWPK